MVQVQERAGWSPARAVLLVTEAADGAFSNFTPSTELDVQEPRQTFVSGNAICVCKTAALSLECFLFVGNTLMVGMAYCKLSELWECSEQEWNESIPFLSSNSH